MPLRRHPVLFLLTLWFSLGCRTSASEATPPLVVFAASSTTEAFRALAEAFEATNPDIEVRLAFAGSQTLRLQLEHGALADVVATADESHLRTLAAHGVVAEVQPFATNRLVVIVPRDNPAQLQTFDDLPKAERIVVGAATVPIGVYTEQLFEGAAERWGATKIGKLREHVVSMESNVRLVRAKVDLGEADAAVVYATDALGHDRVRTIAIPTDLNVPARYFVGRVVRHDAHPAASLWIDFLHSDEARGILARHGFGPPTSR